MTAADNDGITIYRVAHASVAADNEVEELRSGLTGLVGGTPSIRLAIDLSHTYHVSSRVLGVLVAVCKEAQSKGGRMVVFGMNPAIEKVMTVTRLGTILSLARDEAAARLLLLK